LCFAANIKKEGELERHGRIMEMINTQTYRFLLVKPEKKRLLGREYFGFLGYNAV
jgi:hypothetical protein